MPVDDMDPARRERMKQAALEAIRGIERFFTDPTTAEAFLRPLRDQSILAFGHALRALNIDGHDPSTHEGGFFEVPDPFKPGRTLLVAFRCTVGIKR